MSHVIKEDVSDMTQLVQILDDDTQNNISNTVESNTQQKTNNTINTVSSKISE